jgi:hypothetical protein
MTAALIRACWHRSRERRGRVIERVLKYIEYQQANIAAARQSHAKRRKKRLRQAGVVLGKCTRCRKMAL